MKLKTIISRLQKPSTILSIVSQIISIVILLGVNVDVSEVTTITAIICSILVTMGILSNPDTVNGGYGDDILECGAEGLQTAHVQVNGKMLCKDCGAVHA